MDATLQKSHTTTSPSILSVVLEMMKKLLNTFPNGLSVEVEGINMMLLSANDSDAFDDMAYGQNPFANIAFIPQSHKRFCVIIYEYGLCRA